jgi:hypothetical protein
MCIGRRKEPKNKDFSGFMNYFDNLKNNACYEKRANLAKNADFWVLIAIACFW